MLKCVYISLIFPAGLNEELVQLLVLRDELHVEQDAMLVDVEDLTRSESLMCSTSNQVESLCAADQTNQHTFDSLKKLFQRKSNLNAH